MFFNSSSQFKRFISWLVLVCFYFQTLWPSVIFAAEVEVMHPVPLWAPKMSYEPFFMRVLVDNNIDSLEDMEKESCPSSLIPITSDLVEIQDFIDASRSLQTLYKGLRVTEQGLFEWYDQGLCFTLSPGISGMNLVVSPQVGMRPSGAVRIFNLYGDVILVGGLEIERLQVKGMNVGCIGAFGTILELDTFVDEGGRFIIAENASLKTRALNVHAGELQNRGLLINQDYLSVTAPQITNKGQLLAEEGLSVSFQVLNNTGRMYTEGDAEIKLDHELLNADNALMAVHGNTVFSGPGKIHNKAIVQKKKVEGSVEELLTSGMIFNGTVMFGDQDVLNEGTFFGEKIAGVFRRVLNHGSFEGKVFESLRFHDFTNYGIFQGSGLIHVTGVNWGELKGHNLTLDGNLTNIKQGDSKGLVEAFEPLQPQWQQLALLKA
ncbi:MAG: hypothetical protein K2W94_07395 [Alphaproteobacteria bacterium]|nr:hypothetical protein [Alphaproteobacteria bacterium]